jgi:hypothetical protein
MPRMSLVTRSWDRNSRRSIAPVIGAKDIGRGGPLILIPVSSQDSDRVMAWAYR